MSSYRFSSMAGKLCIDQLLAYLMIQILIGSFFSEISLYLNQIKMKSDRMLLLVFIFTLSLAMQDFNKCYLKIIKAQNSPLIQGERFEILVEQSSKTVKNLHHKQFNLVKADPFDACEALQEPDIRKFQKFSSQKDPFLVIVEGDQGACSISRKIKNVKNLGAYGVIVVIDQKYSLIQEFPKNFDENFFVFIAENSDVISILEKTDFILASFEETIRESQSILEIWSSSTDEKSYQLWSDWRYILEKTPIFRSKIEWRFRAVTTACPSCSQQSQTFKCVCNNTLCSPEIHNDNFKASFIEEIRQKIIYEDYRPIFMEYMEDFRQQCMKTFLRGGKIGDCVKTVMTNHLISEDVVQQKMKKFLDTCQSNIYEEFLIDIGKYKHINYYPAVILNGKQIHFSTSTQLHQSLCKILKLENYGGCLQVIKTNITNKYINITTDIIFFLVLIGILGALIFLFMRFYKKKVSREIEKQMKMQVSTSVEHYFTLTDTK